MKDEETIRAYEYKTGFKDGLTCFAHWKDGVQYVGSTGMTLKEAIARLDGTEKLWNYKSPIKEE